MDEPPPLALVNGRVLRTVPGRRDDPHRASTALLVEDGKIARIGDDRAVLGALGRRGDDIDLRGRVVAPGFVDAHIHAFDCAMASRKVSCLPPAVGGLVDLKRRLTERARSISAGEWVIGEGYDDMRLAERRHPTRQDLDEAVPAHPTVVKRVCGHMSVANSRALAIAGIDEHTGDPPGGVIVRDGAGHATGLLLEEAQDLVLRASPPIDGKEIARALVRMGRTLLAHGVTTIGEALLGAFHPNEPEIWSEVLSGGWTGPRVRFLADPRIMTDGSGTGLPIIGTKLFADGVVTGQTAAVSRPFEGDGGSGMLIHEPDALAALVEASVTRGLPVGIHAMGDRAIDVAIDAIESAERVVAAPLQQLPTRRPAGRHRIEHCTLPSSRALQRMWSLGIVPVPQPVFLFAEGEAYKARLGAPRSASAYPLRTMIRRGLRPALSSDAPATSSEDAADPWLGIRAAVTRRTWAGSELGTEEAISVFEAMVGYTASGAFALSLEDVTGSIDVGKAADLIVLPDDPLFIQPQELYPLRPEFVLLRGRMHPV